MESPLANTGTRAPASTIAFNTYPIVRRIFELTDVCTLYTLSSTNRLINDISKLFFKKKLMDSVANARFEFRGPTFEKSNDDQYEMECGGVVLESKNPQVLHVNDTEHSKRYVFRVDDINYTTRNNLTQWDLMDGINMIFPRDCHSDLSAERHGNVHVKFVWDDQEDNEIEDNFVWDGDYLDGAGRQIKVAYFSLYKADPKVGSENESFADFWKDIVEVRISFQAHGDYWKIKRVEIFDGFLFK
jgi:hypothetical protein